MKFISGPVKKDIILDAENMPIVFGKFDKN